MGSARREGPTGLNDGTDEDVNGNGDSGNDNDDSGVDVSSGSSESDKGDWLDASGSNAYSKTEGAQSEEELHSTQRSST